MKNGARIPVHCGCFGTVEEDREECDWIPREDQTLREELDVSSFADPEEDEGIDDVEPSRTERTREGAKGFDTFTSAVAERLWAGEREYRDRSFTHPPGELVGEIEEELEDVAGWAYILWRRLRALADRGRSE